MEKFAESFEEFAGWTDGDIAEICIAAIRADRQEQGIGFPDEQLRDKENIPENPIAIRVVDDRRRRLIHEDPFHETGDDECQFCWPRTK